MPYDLEIPGWMMENELQRIEEISKTVPENGKVLEIGCAFGRSSVAWAQSIPKSATLLCVDPWGMNASKNKVYKMDVTNDDVFETFKNNIRAYNVKYKRMYSDTFFYQNKEKFDVVFIDGDHDSPTVLSDCLNGYLSLNPGGILCGHDYYEDRFPDIVKSVTETERLFNVKKDARVVGGLWSIKSV